VGIQLAHTGPAGVRMELFNLGPLGDGPYIQPERTQGLRDGQLLTPR
jgi:hypothetical protein